MATSKLTVPILLEWKDIEAYMAQHDIVEVVRCRDCKHNPVTAWFGCPMAGTKRRSDDDFCSFGERRDDVEVR